MASIPILLAAALMLTSSMSPPVASAPACPDAAQAPPPPTAAGPVTRVVGEYKSWAGTIQLVATRYPALDLGWYDFNPGGLFTPLPTNVSFAALKIYMSKTLSIGGDNLGVGIWVADESGKVIARLTLSAADFYAAGRSATFIPYCNNGISFQKALQNHR
ncbi:MAG: hypothetical protein QXT77_09515 [Candidatus Methanomethylicaceae archaeon]